jgi:hypothetical protein
MTTKPKLQKILKGTYKNKRKINTTMKTEEKVNLSRPADKQNES